MTSSTSTLRLLPRYGWPWTVALLLGLWACGGAGEGEPADASAPSMDAVVEGGDAGPDAARSGEDAAVGDGGADAALGDAAPAEDATAPADDAGAVDPSPSRLILVHWPHGWTGWAPTRTAGSFELGAQLAVLPEEDAVLVTGLDLGPVEQTSPDDHGRNQLALWAGYGSIDAEASAGHPSLDVVVADVLGESPLNVGVRQASYNRFDPALVWDGAGVPRPVVVELAAAAEASPCASAPAGAPSYAEARASWAERWEMADAHADLVVESFAAGCRRVATVELGTMSESSPGPMGTPLTGLFHVLPVSEELHAATRRAAEWVARLLERLRSTAAPEGGTLFERTLVVFMTSAGRELPLAHENRDVPALLFSGSPELRAGRWLEPEGASIPDLLRTISRAFDAEAPFAASDDGSRALEGVFED